jgi:hypothetical protein
MTRKSNAVRSQCGVQQGAGRMVNMVRSPRPETRLDRRSYRRVVDAFGVKAVELCGYSRFRFKFPVAVCPRMRRPGRRFTAKWAKRLEDN